LTTGFMTNKAKYVMRNPKLYVAKQRNYINIYIKVSL